MNELTEPIEGNPPRLYWKGRLFSQELLHSHIEYMTITQAIGGIKSILEIGAGYGRTAWYFLSMIPDLHYTIIDIYPALGVSLKYLANLFPTKQLAFLEPRQAEKALKDSTFDLSLSISSLDEMLPETKDGYLGLMAEKARYIYLQQHKRYKNPVDGVEINRNDYPLPDGFEALFDRSCGHQVDFFETLWRKRDDI